MPYEVKIYEVWKTVEKYESYEVSQYGRVRNSKGNIIVPNDVRGYKKVFLYKNGKRKCFYIHQLVGIHFVEGRTRYRKEIDHNDNVRHNNYYMNLTWVTRKQNMKDCHARNPHIIENLRIRFTSSPISV